MVETCTFLTIVFFMNARYNVKKDRRELSQ